MPLGDLGEMLGWDGPVTHRQYMAFSAWLDEEWNRPSRTDHYLMRIAQRVVQVQVKHPEKIEMDDQRVQFTSSVREPRRGGSSASASDQTDGTGTGNRLDVATEAAIAKARWVGRMTVPVILKDRDGNVIGRAGESDEMSRPIGTMPGDPPREPVEREQIVRGEQGGGVGTPPAPVTWQGKAGRRTR